MTICKATLFAGSMLFTILAASAALRPVVQLTVFIVVVERSGHRHRLAHS